MQVPHTPIKLQDGNCVYNPIGTECEFRILITYLQSSFNTRINHEWIKIQVIAASI
jgi:hypothetical protein